MSEMEVFCGTFKESDLNIDVSDTDEFFDIEKEHGCYYVEVNGKLYSVTPTKDLDPYGFNVVLTEMETPTILAMWYNGGAGVHEVLHSAIKNHLEK